MHSRHYLELIKYRTVADLQSEGVKSYLGVIWWVLDPLLYLVTFYVVFELLLKRGGEGFVGFLLCGLVFWRWFDACVKQAAVAIHANVHLINQVYLPKVFFPVADMAIASYRFFFVLALLLIFMVFYKGHIAASWLALPVILIPQAILTAGIGVILASIVPFFPDFKKIIDSGMMLLFYMSGIFFDITELSPENQAILTLNPMATLIIEYRAVFMHEQWPDWQSLLLVTLIGATLLVIGVYIISRLDMLYSRIVR